ncbi:MAG: geranylgeranylglycerol-phosphate geranylgeranyltransferase [Fidelibacterota bacterium]
MNILLAILSLLITADILNTITLDTTLFISAAVVATFMAGGNIANDIFDLRTDKINRPNRPLVSGSISIKLSVSLAIILFVTGVFFTLFLNTSARTMALAMILPMLLLYTPVFKRLPLIGNVMVSVLLAMVFIFSEIALTDEMNKMWFPAGLAFGLTLIRELVKDMEDISGDEKAGMKTFPIRFGMEASFYLLISITVILCVYALIPYFTLRFGFVYFLLLVLGVEIPLLFALYWLSKKITPLRLKTVSMILKFCTFMGMMVIWSISLY